MKRNTKEEKKKELIRLKMEQGRLWDAIRNQAWIEYEKPIPHGWLASYKLREDIGKSPEGKVLKHIIKKYGHTVWCRRKDMKVKSFKRKGFEDVVPKFGNISEAEYEKLSRKVKPYFHVDYERCSTWVTRYKPYIDVWKLEVNVERDYKTHYQEHDEILYQLQGENEYNMTLVSDAPWGGYSPAKWWRNIDKRSAKIRHRIQNDDIVKAYNNGDDVDDYESHSSYRTERGSWW